MSAAEIATKTAGPDSSIASLALTYGRNKIPIFPVQPVRLVNGKPVCGCWAGEKCQSPAKHPAWNDWPNAATTDLAVIERLWQPDDMRFGDAPCFNIGVVTGYRSGLVVLDIDPRHGGDETLAQLEREHGPLPPTPRFLTGGGGEHILFRHPGFLVRNSANELGPGVDTRGDGGYIVAPPSAHISGRRYAISVDHHPQDVRFAPLPDWITAKLGCGQHAGNRQPRDWAKFAGSKIPEGRRNTELTSLVGRLFRYHYNEPELVAQLAFAWNETHCSPPLDVDEVATIVGSIYRREAAQRSA